MPNSMFDFHIDLNFVDSSYLPTLNCNKCYHNISKLAPKQKTEGASTSLFRGSAQRSMGAVMAL